MREINFQEATNDWKAWVEECLREIERASRDSSTNTFIDTLLAAADAAAAREILQAPPSSAFSAFINTFLAATSASAALALLIPSGTPMLFQQTSAPTGWTKQTTHNDKALRVVSGTASSGGSVAFSTVFSKTATDATTLTTTQMPVHAHNVTDPTHTHTDNSMVSAGTLLEAGAVFQLFVPTGGTTAAAFTSITIANAGSGGSHTHPMDIRTQFVDIIIATKD
jgi:microcystin-dependent protein